MMALLIRLKIRTFQLVFSAETVFFSRNKSANSVFQPAYQHSRMEPMFYKALLLHRGGGSTLQAIPQNKARKTDRSL
jgi:hypothetical protein